MDAWAPPLPVKACGATTLVGRGGRGRVRGRRCGRDRARGRRERRGAAGGARLGRDPAEAAGRDGTQHGGPDGERAKALVGPGPSRAPVVGGVHAPTLGRGAFRVGDDRLSEGQRRYVARIPSSWATCSSRCRRSSGREPRPPSSPRGAGGARCDAPSPRSSRRRGAPSARCRRRSARTGRQRERAVALDDGDPEQVVRGAAERESRCRSSGPPRRCGRARRARTAASRTGGRGPRAGPTRPRAPCRTSLPAATARAPPRAGGGRRRPRESRPGGEGVEEREARFHGRQCAGFRPAVPRAAARWSGRQRPAPKPAGTQRRTRPCPTPHRREKTPLCASSGSPRPFSPSGSRSPPARPAPPPTPAAPATPPPATPPLHRRHPPRHRSRRLAPPCGSLADTSLGKVLASSATAA